MFPAQLKPCETRAEATLAYRAASAFQIDPEVRCPTLSGTRNSTTNTAATATSSAAVEIERPDAGARRDLRRDHP